MIVRNIARAVCGTGKLEKVLDSRERGISRSRLARDIGYYKALKKQYILEVRIYLCLVPVFAMLAGVCGILTLFFMCGEPGETVSLSGVALYYGVTFGLLGATVLFCLCVLHIKDRINMVEGLLERIDNL